MSGKNPTRSYRDRDHEVRKRRTISEARFRLQQLGEDLDREVQPLRAAVELEIPAGERLRRRHLLESCVRVTPAIDPVFVLRARYAGASRRGERGFSLTATTGSAERLLKAIPRTAAMAEASWKGKHTTARKRQGALVALFESAGLAKEECPLAPHGEIELRDRERPEPCLVVLSRQRKGGLYVRLVTVAGGNGPIPAGSALDAWSWSGVVKRPPLRPDEAAELLYRVRQHGVELDDPAGVADEIDALVRTSVALHEVHGMPGLCELTEGQASGAPVRRRRLTGEAGMRVVRKRAGADGVMVADRVADVARMSEARDVLDDELFPPQRRVVGAHLATEYGFLDASQVGTGKTTMTLKGQRRKTLGRSGFRALIVCQKELCEQWAEEAAERFPEARTFLPARTRFGRELVRFERETGDEPGLVIVGYEQARAGVSDLELLTYSEIVIDECDWLANPGTQLSRALWRLRARAAVGIGLTGTPVGRSLEELDSIIAFCRDDERARRERPIGRAFSGLDSLSRQRLHEALGPVLQRVSRAELRDHMPEIGEVETLRLSPGPALRDLLVAIDTRIADLYAGVKERAEAAAAAGSAVAGEARKELARMRGVLLGGVTVARMAKDPEALRTSKAQVAQLLEAEGLLQAAIEEGSPSRRIVARAIADAVRDGEQVLCFSEFTSHLQLLCEELRSEHGLEVPVYAGGLARGESTRIKRAFRAGELGCALVGKIGYRGHNLQPASEEAVVVHYDLLWEPRGFEQRTGRAGRLGAGAELVAVLVPVLRHSIEERVAHILLPRAARAVEALSRGVGDEPLAVQLHALAAELGSDEEASTLIQVCEQILAEHAGVAAGK